MVRDHPQFATLNHVVLYIALQFEDAMMHIYSFHGTHASQYFRGMYESRPENDSDIAFEILFGTVIHRKIQV